MNDEDDFRASFTLVCKKCGSENVALDIEQGVDYGEEIGDRAGHINIRCSDCKQNSVFITI